MELREKTIVIIGASQGIGYETAKLCSEKGSIVYMLSKTKEKIEEAARTINKNTFPVALDFTDELAVKNTLSKIRKIDHLVCVGASNPVWGKFNELESAALHKAFESKFFGYFYSAKYAIPLLSKYGSIVFVIAGSARKAIPGTSGLAAVNGAILSMGKTMAAELGPIRINIVSPGVIDTPYYDRMPKEQKNALFRQMENRLPAGRVGKAEEVANGIVSLLENDFITGAVLDIDGGGSL